jgi:hypothetical protein
MDNTHSKCAKCSFNVRCQAAMRKYESGDCSWRHELDGNKRPCIQWSPGGSIYCGVCGYEWSGCECEGIPG